MNARMALPGQGLRTTDPERTANEDRRGRIVGSGLVALGVLFVTHNVGVESQWVWPIALIALGVILLVQRSRP